MQAANDPSTPMAPSSWTIFSSRFITATLKRKPDPQTSFLPHNPRFGRREGGRMDEEEVVVGAQLLGLVLKLLGVVLTVALAFGVFSLWRRLS